MLIPIFGTPSPLTYWVSSVARIICDTLQGSHLFITPVSLEDLKSAWNERNERAVVMQLEIPQREVIDIFIDIGAPMYMAVDDPVDVTIYTQTSRDLEFRIAVKLVSQSFSILSDVYACGNIELIDPLWYNLLPAEFLRRFISRLHLKMSDEQQREILHKITKEKPNASSVLPLIIGNNFHARVPGAYSAPGGPHEESIIRRIIPQYGALLKSKSRRISLIWPREIFPDRDNLAHVLDGARPLLGPARILFGGHTLHLPSGEWVAVVDLEVAGNFSGNRLLSQVFSGEKLLHTVIAKLPVNGRFAYEMDFSIYDAFYPIQVIVAIAEGAIEGEITLHSCELRPKKSELAPTV